MIYRAIAPVCTYGDTSASVFPRDLGGQGFDFCNLQSDFCNLQSLGMPDPGEIDHAARLLRAGRLVAFPTETVYGLGANALDAEAVARIYAVKRRPATSPLIVHVASIEMAQSLVGDWPEIADRLARRFWPGPLTLVLPKSQVEADAFLRLRSGPAPAERSSAPPSSSSWTIPATVTAGLPTVGLRMPAHPIALALIRAVDVPLAAPSANRFTELSPTTADHVRLSLGGDVDYILDGGPCSVGIESTVLSLAGPEPVLLRPGGISRTELEAIAGPVASAQEVEAGAHPSPGMHPRHYSPRTPLLLVKDGKLPDQGPGVYLQHQHLPSRESTQTIQMPAAAADYAAALYEVLHQADAGNYNWIAVDLPPNSPEWEAVHDRLRRAASNS
jgi:L-threonylcarbamoyladenylate synthase